MVKKEHRERLQVNGRKEAAHCAVATITSTSSKYAWNAIYTGLGAGIPRGITEHTCEIRADGKIDPRG
jgi:hypothetical protein